MTKKVTTKIRLDLGAESGEKKMAGIVYNWKTKKLKFGCPVKLEMTMRDLIGVFFHGYSYKLCGDRRIRVNGKTRTRGKISFVGHCSGYRFKSGYKKMTKARKKGGVEFDEVDSIGRILN